MSRNKIKKYLLFLGLLLSGVSTLYILNLSKNPIRIPTNETDSPQQSNIFLPEGTLLPELKLKTPTNISTPIPETLPTYYSEKTSLNIEEATIIAKALGFLDPPEKRVNDKNETTSLIWEKPNFERVSIFLSGRTINYTNEGLVDAQNLNQQTSLQNLSKFLDKINQSIQSKLFIQDIKYYKRVHAEEKTFSSITNANYAVASITQKINGFPIIGLNYTNTFDSASIFRNEVYSAHLTIPNTSFTSEYPIKLATSVELLKRFDKSKLISYNIENKPISTNDDYPNTPLDTTGTEIAYFYNETNSSFTPVLVVYAKGKNSDNLNVTATFVVDLEK